VKETVRAALLARIRDTVLRHRLIDPGDRIVIGLSGGPDSVTLAHLLPEVARGLGAQVVAVAHLNHQLRPEAGEDEAFCHEVAARLDLPLDTDRVDVRAEAARGRTSLEDAGRTVRYRFLRQVADARQASRVAVAHTLNDQAETVLLRLFRGAGPVGLAGIYPQAGLVIRPLLDVRRLEVEAWLAAERLPFRDDPSNRDVTIPRNRIRHELLPYLARHVGDGILEVLARQAVIAREDAEWLEHEATETSRSLVLEVEGRTVVALSALRALPAALRRRVIRTALQRHAGDRFIGFDHVEAVLVLGDQAGEPVAGEPDGERKGREAEAANEPPAHGSPARRSAPDRASEKESVEHGQKTIDLPGQRVKRSMGRLVFEPVSPDPARAGRRRGRPRRGLAPVE
jgi:tRNA(Ile)-lysidine synthase